MPNFSANSNDCIVGNTDTGSWANARGNASTSGNFLTQLELIMYLEFIIFIQVVEVEILIIAEDHIFNLIYLEKVKLQNLLL